MKNVENGKLQIFERKKLEFRKSFKFVYIKRQFKRINQVQQLLQCRMTLDQPQGQTQPHESKIIQCCEWSHDLKCCYWWCSYACI